MRIAYFANWVYLRNSGVWTKIFKQMKLLSDQGGEVTLYALTQREYADEFVDPLPSFCRVVVEAYDKESQLARHMASKRLCARCLQNDPDVVYWRCGQPYMGLGKLLKVKPSVVEVNNLRPFPSPHKHKVWQVITSRVLRNVDGVIPLTFEMSEHPFLSSLRAEHRVISNGVLDFAEPPATETPKTAAMLASKFIPEVGIERMFTLAEELDDYTFEVAGGTESDRERYAPKAPDNVRFLGMLAPDDVAKLLGRSRFGFSKLAAEVKGNEGNPLKVRTYLGHGVPVILGHKDTDFSGKDYTLTVEPGEWVNTKEIAAKVREFSGRWEERRVSRQELEFASAEAKERERFDFMSHVSQSSPKTRSSQSRVSRSG